MYVFNIIDYVIFIHGTLIKEVIIQKNLPFEMGTFYYSAFVE